MIYDIEVRTEKQLQVVDITKEVGKHLVDVDEGSLTLFVPHTTAALTIQEADEELWDDMLEIYKRLVPLKNNYKHNAKYGDMTAEQNAHAHILSSLIKPSVHIPVKDGKMVLGTWQRVLFIELDGGRARKVMMYILEP